MPGAPLTYTVVVTNRAVECDQCAGAGCAAGAAGGVQLDLHGERCGCGVRDGGGSGDIDALVTLPAGTTSTFTVSGTVPAGTTGALVNTATVTPPAGVTDPVPGNNSGDRHQPGGAAGGPDDQQGEQSGAVRAGGAAHLHHRGEQRRAGDVSNARVQDALPAPLAGFGWTCTASGAGARAARPAGSGDIDALVTLPVGTTSPSR